MAKSEQRALAVLANGLSGQVSREGGSAAEEATAVALASIALSLASISERLEASVDPSGAFIQVGVVNR